MYLKMSREIIINETIREVDIAINQNVVEVNVTRTSGIGGVQSVTGNVVDNTDPLNPVINVTIHDIPTKTSDLINDGEDGNSVFVQANQLGAVATSNDFNDLDNKPKLIPLLTGFSDAYLDIQTVVEANPNYSEYILGFTGTAPAVWDLPVISAYVNKKIRIINFTAFSLTINASEGIFIDNNSVTEYVIEPYKSAEFLSNFSSKHVLTYTDNPKSLEIKYISHNNAITKSDTAYYLVNNDEGIPVSNIDIDFDSGFVKDDVIQLTKIAQTVDADSVLNVRAIKTIGDPPEFYFGVGFNTLASGDIAFSIKAGDVVTMRFFSDWQVLVDIQRKNVVDFEIQFTQTGTDAPVIIAGSIKGAGTATLTPSYSIVGCYIITSDQPTFANVKDCFLGVFNKTSIFTVGTGGGNIKIVSYYVYDDYNLQIEVCSFDFGEASPEDGSIKDPVQIKLEYKF